MIGVQKKKKNLSDFNNDIFPRVEQGDFIVFKRGGNTGENMEPQDLVLGIVENTYIKGVYLGGQILLDNFNIIEQIDF